MMVTSLFSPPSQRKGAAPRRTGSSSSAATTTTAPDTESTSGQEAPVVLALNNMDGKNSEDKGISTRADIDEEKEKPNKKKNLPLSLPSKKDSLSAKTVVSTIMFSLIGLVIWDALLRAPEDRWLQPDFSQNFLRWVQAHPLRGLLAILLVIAVAVVLMIPIGTPLTLGCGYIYKGAYGWQIGLTIATAVSMGGSALGAVTCFLLGRYLMRDQVRKWIKKYPLFDAIDVAAAEHGLRIMAMLYLTPILPLGPVSYMCGTTSMSLSAFVLAKVASLPLMLLYVFIGASTGALIGGGKASESEVKAIEENETLIISGIILSFVMIAGITQYIKKELNKILERQGKHKPGEVDQEDAYATEAAAIEMGATSMNAPRQRRVA